MSWQGTEWDSVCGFKWSDDTLDPSTVLFHTCGLEEGHLFDHQCGIYRGVDPERGALVRCRAEIARV